MLIHRRHMQMAVIVVTAALTLITAATAVLAQNAPGTQGDAEAAGASVDYQTAIETYILDRPQETASGGGVFEEVESFLGERIVVYSHNAPSAMEEGTDKWRAEAHDPDAAVSDGPGAQGQAADGSVTQNFAFLNILFAVVAIVVGAFVTLLVLEALRSVQNQFR